MLSLYALIIGFLLDLCFGDPYHLPHPIRLIGWLISKLEGFYRNIFKINYDSNITDELRARRERVAGRFLVFTVCLFSTGLPLLILLIANAIHPILRLFVESIMCYQLLATKSLRTESMKVYYALKDRDTEKARAAVSMIVGRDTESLTEEGIAKATVETIAENTSDGSIAPMLFMAVGGAAAGFFYKSINTMDSMIGYKNDNYINLGRFAAKTDDVLNYIPARISAYLMVLATFFLNYNWKNAFFIYKRDRYNHSSPNSAHTEAVCAGALEISLAGDAYYFGKLYKKKTIGDGIRNIEFEDIRRANRLLYGTALIGLALVLCLKGLILYFVL